ncbi:MAG TPA: SMP-30/gluconolactonase/LRE family protein [Thermoanaerobaculia bacterium]|nr:SMP-30/gluconolactonase/LRE family protein [Thermoanaerobaculia bacterium]
MRRALLLTIILGAACGTTAPPQIDEQTRGLIAQLTEALAQQPTNLPWIYILAQSHDRAHNPGEAARWLARLDELGWEQGVNPADFRNTGADRAVHAAMAKLDARQPRVSQARVAFTIQGQRDLVPEGIAYDPVDDVFYLSSIHRRKVVRVDRAGAARDFVPEAQDGMLSSLGMKVDAARRLLWVVSTGTPEMRGATPEDEQRSILAAYDLRGGRLVRKVEATPALLNDLALLSDGSLFATDMGRQKVVRLGPGANTLEDWADGFSYPNGIAVSGDERFLYVADFRGVTRITIADRTRQPIQSRALLNGIDGLSFHDGNLLAIQNAIGSPRVLRIDPATGAVEVLESKNALFEIPLTGAVAGGEYWFIANPGLRSFGEDHKIWPAARLQDPVMLRLPLPKS